MTKRWRILFVAENVTLAQVVRLVALAKSLDPRRYEVHFACSDFDPLVFHGTSFHRWPIHTISRWFVDRAIESGRRIYDQRTLRRYVKDELELFRQVQPDLVVGDFRQSLAVSAPVAGIPYANLINAYWSPHAERDAFPLPDHPMVRLLGEDLAGRHFPRAMPWVFDHFARPVNDVRKEYGLPSLGSLPDVLTAADAVLFPDIPSLVPTRDPPSHHHYLGPVLWSPDVSLPEWWSRVDRFKPTIYVTLGSSGKIDLLPTVIDGLRDLPVNVMLATAGRARAEGEGSNILSADYLPGHLAARRADLVICNGGSTTGYQALAEGTPVIGVPFNLDQYLSMQAIERYGAGVTLRSGTLSAPRLRAAVALVLAEPAYAQRARSLGRELSLHDARAEFVDIVEKMTAGHAATTRLAAP